MEIKTDDCVKDVIANNLELFFQLDLIGIKDISTAIDYLSIYQMYKEHSWIKKVKERQMVVANRYRVSPKTVQRAVILMEKQLNSLKKNPTI